MYSFLQRKELFLFAKRFQVTFLLEVYPFLSI